MKRLFIISLIGFSNILIAQNNTNYSLDVMGGIDYSKLLPVNDSLDVTPRISPYFGLAVNIPINTKDEIQFGSLYRMKASLDELYSKYRSIGLGVFGKYSYRLSNSFWLNLGGIYTVPLKSYALISKHSQYISVVKEVKINKYKSYFSLTAGLKIKLNEHLFLDVAGEYPINNPYLASFPNLTIGLTFRIDNNSFNFSNKDESQEQSKALIKQIKNTALLVSLPSYQHQIETYKEAGDKKMMKKIIANRDKKNKALITAFKEYFDFCPVYFFYNHNNQEIKNKNLTGLFLDENLKPSKSIILNADNFLIGKLGYSNTDTNNTKSYTDVYKNSFNIADGYAKSSTKTSDYSNYGFTIVNQNFEFIGKPFPSHTRGYYLFKRLPLSEIVRNLNIKLHKYHKKSTVVE